MSDGKRTGGDETYYFHILQHILVRSFYVGLWVDVRHVAPVVAAIVVISSWCMGVIEDEAIDTSRVNHGI